MAFLKISPWRLHPADAASALYLCDAEVDLATIAPPPLDGEYAETVDFGRFWIRAAGVWGRFHADAGSLGGGTPDNTTFLRGDLIFAVPPAGTPSDTVEDETAFGQVAAAGVSGEYARGDHTHGTPTNPVPAHEAAPDPHTQYQKESEKGAASGYAALDAGVKVPTAQLGSGLADGTKVLFGDQSWGTPPSGTPADSVVTETGYGQGAAVGVGTDYAREDHTHGTPSLGASSTTACAGDDARLSNARTPTAHAVSHQNNGADEISVAGLSGALADPQTPTAHAASHQALGADPIKLDDLAAPDDNTDLNVSTAKHGLAPKAPNDATKYLDGTGAYSVPAGGSGLTHPQVMARISVGV